MKNIWLETFMGRWCFEYGKCLWEDGVWVREMFMGRWCL